jgi:hypothetical protein
VTADRALTILAMFGLALAAGVHASVQGLPRNRRADLAPRAALVIILVVGVLAIASSAAHR